MSAPPEVVFNTAIDPARLSGWLPEPLRQGTLRQGSQARPTADPARPTAPVRPTADPAPPAAERPALRASWQTGGRAGWSAQLRVEPTPAGGATAHFDLAADEPDQNLTELAQSCLAGLARQVADNLTAG